MKDRLTKEISHDYVIISFLGKGAFGTVIQCRNLSNHQDVALKVIKKYKLNEKQLHSSIHESELLSRLDHPNIVKFIALRHTDSFLILEMELLTGKTLGDLIATKPNLTEDESAAIMRQIFLGVSYLHKVQVLHRDLKPDNIMFVDESHTHLKITDFGLSTKYSLEETLDQRSGTRAYMAPEQFLLKQYNDPIDIWSCGIILYQVITCMHPFSKQIHEGLDYTEILQNINWTFPDSFPALAKDLFLRCTMKNPLERYTASLALHHPWITRTKGKIPMTHMEEYRIYHDKLKLKKMIIACVQMIGFMPHFNLGIEYLKRLNDPNWKKKEVKKEEKLEAKHDNHPKKVNSMSSIDLKNENLAPIKKKGSYGNQLFVPNSNFTLGSIPNSVRHKRTGSKNPSRSPSPCASTSLNLPKTAVKGNRNKYIAH